MFRSKIKAQTAIEFLIVSIAVFLFFFSFLSVINWNNSVKLREKNFLAVENLAREIQGEINLAVESSDGFERTFVIPSKIIGRDFEVNVSNGGIYLITDDGDFSVAVEIPEVEGDFVIGENVVRKINGEIYLN